MPLYGNELDRDDHALRRGPRAGRQARQAAATSSGRAALEKVAARRRPEAAGRPRDRGPGHRPPRLPGPRRGDGGPASSPAGTHVADPRRAHRDGATSPGRRGTRYDARGRASATQRVPAEVVAAAVLPATGLGLAAAARTCGRPTALQPSSRPPAALTRRRRRPMIPADLRYTKDHEWVRVDGRRATVGITAVRRGPARRRRVRRAARRRAGRSTQFATFGVVESVKAVSDLYRAASAARSCATNDALDRHARAGQQRPVRRGLDAPPRGRPTRRRSDALLDAAAYEKLVGGGADAAMPYGPHTADDRARMLATIGVASVDELFADIPAELRASPLDLPRAGARARAERAPARRSPARNRVDLASFLGAGRVPPLQPAGGRPDAAARRVVHGLHAVPARGQPGHAPERSTSTSRCSPSSSASTSCRPRTTTAARPRPRPP